MDTYSEPTNLHVLCAGCAAILESPTGTAVNTAVNTANPSRAPSLCGESRDDSKLEEGLASKEIEPDNSEGETDGESPLPSEKKTRNINLDVYVVGWDGPNDPENPMNFSLAKKWSITMITALLTFCVSFASSIFSTATFATADEFGVSPEVMILGVSLYVLGFACGKYSFG